MRKKFFEEHKGIAKRISCLALAVMIAGTGFLTYHNTTTSNIPELVTFVDPETSQVEEDEVPLASKSKTTKKVTTKTTTQKTTMPQKAKKTKTTTKKNTKNSTKSTSNSIQKVKTNTKVVTTIKTKTKKNSKVKTTQTKVVTTVTTTTTQLSTKQYSKTASSSSSTAAAATSAAKTSETTTKAGTYSIRTYAPAADARVLSAFEKIGCKLVVNPSVSYSGCFDARNRTITLKKLDSTVYHELGHFVEFVGGTSAVKQAIASAYSAEKSKYTASNKAYVLQNSSEYFAESFRNYCENPAALKQARPMTYEAVVQALQNMTDSRVNTLMGVYKSVWK